MFDKILIANRGEIACRVIETAQKMGVRTVAVYSDADQFARHVKMADEAIHLGPPASKDSYLQAQKVIDAALKTGAQAVHPGYGFLSENAEFCRLCEQNDITFIGPPVAAIEAMGSKSAAKSIMEQAQVPLVPGYHGEDQSAATIKQAADDMGYPVLLKAAAGGGGKGMRQVWSSQEFAEGFAAAKREAMSSFGDDIMLVEKYLTQPRHVEIQVFCDRHGNSVYLFERDCSVQRRHQKVIEEAPAFGMSESLRAQMGEAAIKAAQAIGYVGAGTVEFLLDTDGSFYFMEMNTRLQVEHPVTEMISGQDLVEWQLRVASGETLPKSQSELTINGHAFEARIYAENPENEFLPATGVLSLLKTPLASEHVRVDTGVEQGDEVSVFYDPMIAKLIVWDENREKALKRLTKALGEYQIDGVVTNRDFLLNLASTEAFKQEDIDTGFIAKHQDAIFHQRAQDIQQELPMAVLAWVLKHDNGSNNLEQNQQSPWLVNKGWRLNQPSSQVIELKHNEDTFVIDIEHLGQSAQGGNSIRLRIAHELFDGRVINASGILEGDQLQGYIDGYRFKANLNHSHNQYALYLASGVFKFEQILADLGNNDDSDSAGGFTAPMNGTMVQVLVNAGDSVEKDQALVIMEAMKMEHTIRAPQAGKVDAIFYSEGDMVDGGAELLSFIAKQD